MNIRDYTDLTTIDKPKFNALVESVLSPIISGGGVIESFDLAFLLDNAVGEQLDIIGEIVGVSRLIPFVPTVGDREMSDDEYRVILMFGIAKNNWDGSIDGVYKALQGVFGDNLPIAYVDNQNMTIDVQVYGSLSSRMIELMSASDVLLVPMGVGKTVSIVGGSVDCTAGVYSVISGIEWEESVDAN